MGAMSDDENNTSPGKSNDLNYYERKEFAKSTKKMCESSLNVSNNADISGLKSLQSGSQLGGGLDINALASKLQEVNDEDEAAEQKKRDFEKKRMNHYKNEFQMAKLL